MYPTKLPLLLLSLTLLAACGKEEPKVVAQAPADPMLVIAPAALLPQLKIGEVVTAPVTENVRVAGKIDFDEQRLARIGATVTGRVSELIAVPGQSVRAGEPLAMLNSTELGAAQLAYLKARAQADLASSAAERARSLYQGDVIGSAELQRRESEQSIAAAERRAASDQLRVLGLPAAAIRRLDAEGAINSLSPVVSSLAGVVVDRRVTQGQVVGPTDTLFTVADLSRVWAVAQVPEEQASKVKPGQSVSIEVAALDGEQITGRLIHVGETVNPETRTVLVRTELDNREHRLKPSMLATMLIAGKAVERPVVPAAAVVRENDADHVFVVVGNAPAQNKSADSATPTAKSADGTAAEAPVLNQFRLTRVELGPESGGQRAVLSGVKPGERIVVDGAFHLNNERKRKELEGS
ncbi:efflux RND transporter periplasmic adaptor subunit [Rhodocyclus gracilis]|uniref:Efflux RND transporter periplasmic adaptor subunit n=1 Tax=Rhodocyclus tenuis TaxID=1066 RepID=A0A6L5JTY3_RHOTE|nr:efflux RND transporter periplasmic adaptor subunit [Rhodocyclus gracilis]MQY50282.1 efflux RND transporter periplasmic adaptor subunit [Rhodocyclus gracilis]